MSGALDSTVLQWDVRRKRVLGRQRFDCAPGLAANPPLAHCVDVSRNGHAVAAAVGDGTVALFAWKGLRHLAQWAGHKTATSAVCFLRSSSQLVSGGVDQAVALWSTAGKELARWEHLGKVNWLAASPVSDQFFVASSSSIIHMVVLGN